MRYQNRTIFTRPTAHGLLVAVAACAIAMLTSVVARAQSTLTLTAQTADLSIVSPDAPSQLPAIVSADAAPLLGQIVLANESHLERSTLSASNETVGKFSIVVTSMFDHRVMDRCELTSVSGASSSPTHDNEAAKQRWEFQFTQRLPSGVYELKLEPTVSVSARFRELLPWERSGSKDRHGDVAHTLSTQSWPLIVLPKTTSTAAVVTTASDTAQTATASERATTRQLFVHWAGFADMVADAESLTSSSPLSSPLTWILTSSNHVQMTPPQRWAEIMQRIDERLDAIHAAGADGIVVDRARAGSTDDAMAPHMILMQCLHAKATQLDLVVWQPETVAATPEQIPADGARLTLTRLESWPPAESRPPAEASSHHLRVATFLRPPSQTIRGQFPAEMDAAADADLLWFGCQSSADVTSHPTLSATDADAQLAASDGTYPLAARDNAWLADAWLADWSSWCIYHTSLQLEKGLIIDETLLRPERTSVSDVAMLWDTCWSETSRWLADSAVVDVSKTGGAVAKSLVQVRHANAGDGTILVCVNQAPWPMRVRFPLANLVRWAEVAPAQVGSVQLTKPAVTELGSTIVIPASSMLVCYAEQRISPAMHFSAETDDTRKRVAELTRQVTNIVENLGILGELAGMSARANSLELRLTGGRRTRSVQANLRQASAIRPSATSVASEKTASVTTASGGSSFWSTERWGLSRAVTSSSDSSSQTVHPVSITTAGDVSQSSDLKSFDASLSSGSAPSKCRNLLVNGGFEMPHEIGVSGWMQAHHPFGAVEIDTLIRSEGRQSIRLQGKTTTGASAWLISREIARPIGGRLGISMSLRGEVPHSRDASGTPADPDVAAEPIEIRVAIEGERNGLPIRHSETVRVAANGKWHVERSVLQWLDVDSQQDHNLHITIDNLSSSTVWIDDIVVTDYFASDKERSDLQSLAYLAVQGLQHSDLRPAAKLMRNFWAQDLLRIAHFQSAFSERGPDSVTLTRDIPNLEKTRSERGFPSPMWGAGTVQANPVQPISVPTQPVVPNDGEQVLEQSENAYSATQLPRLPASSTLPVTPSEDAASEPTEADSAASLGGKLRRWLPPPLKF